MRNFLILTLILTFAVGSSFAGAPSTMSYQGRLTDNVGDPVSDNTYSVEFRIYGSALGGLPAWSETQDVTTSDGFFSVLLGSVTPIASNTFAGTTRYLGITVGGDAELSPLTALVSVPYAFRVRTVDGATGGNITSKVSIGSDHTNSGDHSFVAGRLNSTDSAYSVVSGGLANSTEASYTTIGGGGLNTASGYTSVVGGGEGNEASGRHSTVPGGRSNVASGNYSFAAGLRAKANHHGSFVWADSANSDFASTDQDQFLVRADGGVGINYNNPSAELHIRASVSDPDTARVYLGTSGSWTAKIEQANTSVFTITNGGTKKLSFTPGGRFGIGTVSPSQELHVVGDICYTGSIGACSDVRYKQDITNLSGSLDNILRMRGVTYRWKQDEYPDQNFGNGTHLGFIAQEVEQLYPEMVMTDEEGYKSVDYSRLTPVIVEAIKEQQAQIDFQQKQIDELKKLVQQIAQQKEGGTPTLGLK